MADFKLCIHPLEFGTYSNLVRGALSHVTSEWRPFTAPLGAWSLGMLPLWWSSPLNFTSLYRETHVDLNNTGNISLVFIQEILQHHSWEPCVPFVQCKNVFAIMIQFLLRVIIRLFMFNKKEYHYTMAMIHLKKKHTQVWKSCVKDIINKSNDANSGHTKL